MGDFNWAALWGKDRLTPIVDGGQLFLEGWLARPSPTVTADMWKSIVEAHAGWGHLRTMGRVYFEGEAVEVDPHRLLLQEMAHAVDRIKWEPEGVSGRLQVLHTPRGNRLREVIEAATYLPYSFVTAWVGYGSTSHDSFGVPAPFSAFSFQRWDIFGYGLQIEQEG